MHYKFESRGIINIIKGLHLVHWCYFYHGCNILTNQIAQKEVDKSHINLNIIYQPTRYLLTSKWGVRA